MANIHEEARIPVYLNDEQAKSALKNLQGEADKWRKKMHEAMAGGDMKGMKEAERELKKVNKEASKLRKASFDVNQVLNNLSSASAKDLKNTLRQLYREQEQVNRKTREYAALDRNIKLVKTELSKVNGQLKTQRSFLSRAADGFNKYFAVVTAGAASFAGLILGARKAVDTFNEFEETSDNLAALTGLNAEQMAYLEKQAENTSHTIVEGNVRIKQSAKDILDAYTLVGSQRPELLMNKEALHQVTKEAIILSAASRMQLEPAAAALANTLNQFNETSDQSRRIINILAAGSQAGAGNIEYLSQAIEKTGTTANLMNISIEQTVGAIETVAPYYKRAEMAGNSLDKVLLRMKADQIGYKDGVFDLNRAIDELRTRYANGESAAKIFGVEHAKMGELLVLNQGEFNRYTEAVTGSNKAIEQASINTDNNNAKLAQARNERQIAIKDLGEKLAPVMTHVVSKGSMMVKFLSVMFDFLSKYGRVIISTTAAIAAYTIAVKVAANWDRIHYGFLVTKDAVTKAYAFTQGVLTGKIKLATVAQRAWNTAQKANPIGLIAGILVGAGVALAAYIRKVNSLTAEQKVLNDVEKTAQQNIVEQKLKVEDLLQTARNEKLSLDERKKALEELNKISPEYFGNLSLEKINSEEATTATEAYTEALLKQARVQAAKEKLIELEKQRIEAIQTGSDYENKWWQTAINGVKSFGNAAAFSMNQAVTGAKNAIKSEEDYIKQKETLIGLIEKQKGSGTETSPGSLTLTPQGDGKSARQQELELQLMETKNQFDLMADQEQDFTKLQYDELEKRKKQNRDYADEQIRNLNELKDAEQDLVNAKLDLASGAIDVLIQLAGEESAIGKALFLLDQARAIGQVIFNTGIANAKAVAASPLTAGQPWVGINSAQAGVSIAAILGQTIAKFSINGKKDGGYTGWSTSDNTPMGIYHANEWFANAQAVRNPEVKKVLDVFDIAQRNGSIANLKLPAIISAILPGIGKKSGGYTSTNVQPGVSPPSQGGGSPDLSGRGGSDALLAKLDQLGDRIERLQISVAVETIEKEREKYIKMKKTSGL